MDTSTLLFVAILAGTFLVLRWIITPIPHSVPEEFNIPDPSQIQASSLGRDAATVQARSRRAGRRHVSDSMVEVVQAIAPQLTRSQIVYSLERTGNVEDTVNVYISTGTLPFPPGESGLSRPTNSSAPGDSGMLNAETPRANGSSGNGGSGSSASLAASKAPVSLLEKYKITPEIIALADENGLPLSDENGNSLHNRKVEMILKARKRLEKTLTEPALQ